MAILDPPSMQFDEQILLICSRSSRKFFVQFILFFQKNSKKDTKYYVFNGLGFDY
jgi:hypothetical protein